MPAHFLGYKDGQLCNNLYLEIANKIHTIALEVINKHTAPIQVEFMTFDPGGISGHIDHIAISHITTFVYLKLKQDESIGDKIYKLKFFCLEKDYIPDCNTNWLYMPCGYDEDEIDEVIDISDVYEKKLEIMMAHKSQATDMKNILNRQKVTKTGQSEHFRYF